MFLDERWMETNVEQAVLMRTVSRDMIHIMKPDRPSSAHLYSARIGRKQREAEFHEWAISMTDPITVNAFLQTKMDLRYQF
jgi:hypothetical protein